ncbi:hypothetical protein Vadar_025676 [Vaccinium darrowii]|uniref:Uncharacterized protein n=1 Tax=Vaccinium darrowii TaxID=229202 RepID=A0ACB7Y228_9ERIC|nr:hypothetical protein Vadar_025676 [Vaccinium darrowii]
MTRLKPAITLLPTGKTLQGQYLKYCFQKRFIGCLLSTHIMTPLAILYEAPHPSSIWPRSPFSIHREAVIHPPEGDHYRYLSFEACRRARIPLVLRSSGKPRSHPLGCNRNLTVSSSFTRSRSEQKETRLLTRLVFGPAGIPT